MFWKVSRVISRSYTSKNISVFINIQLKGRSHKLRSGHLTLICNQLAAWLMVRCRLLPRRNGSLPAHCWGVGSVKWAGTRRPPYGNGMLLTHWAPRDAFPLQYVILTCFGGLYLLSCVYKGGHNYQFFPVNTAQEMSKRIEFMPKETYARKTYV